MTKILVIEDEDLIRMNILDMLELEGFDVIGAENGRVGLHLAREHMPDLIICDIQMPELDGYEVLLALRSQPDTAMLPFIFLTARVDRAYMRHGMELGADDYLTKPFSMAELLVAVISRLERHSTVVRMTEQELTQAKESLIRVVSHELRTPLVSVTMVTDVLMRQIEHMSAGQTRELLEALDRGTQRLSRLVEQIVFIIQLETGALHQDHILENGVPIYLSEVLVAAVDLARRFAYRLPDVSVRLDTRDSTALVISDIRALRHALAEVITNALSFAPEGSEIVVSQWSADDAVWVGIVDHGPGISPEKMEQALMDFQQIDRERQEQQGIGLGLPLARRIIEAHGGSFDLRSVVGKGTQVTMSLPISSREAH